MTKNCFSCFFSSSFCNIYQLMYLLRELAGLECQTPCCSSPSGSWFHIWPLVQASHPPCPNHLCHPVDPGEGPDETYGYRSEVHGLSMRKQCTNIHEIVLILIYLKARYRPTFTLYYISDQPVMLANIMEVLCQLQLHKNRQSTLQKCTFIACCNCWSTRKHLQPISVKHIYQGQFVCHPFTVHDSKLKYKCFKTARENKTVPECQWKKDWPHLPLTSPPGSSHSCHPSPLPGPALSSATKQNTLHTTCLLQSFTFLQLKQILILTTLHLLPIPTSHPSLPPQLSEAEGALTFNCSD